MNTISPILICKECIVDKRLKLLIEKYNSNGLCSCCGENNNIIDTDSNEFIQMIKALIRYHYSEWEYDTHLGGDGIFNLFKGHKNLFFHKSRFQSQKVYDDLIDNLDSCEYYEEYDKGVSLSLGYFDGGRNLPLQAIKNDLDKTILKIGERLKKENYFLLEIEMKQIITQYQRDAKIHFKTGESFYRGRIGYDTKKHSILHGGWEGKMIYVPYMHDNIGAPPPTIAQVGRLNRHGVSFFYCATDKYTAISEIRPHPGDIVSIGKFELKNDVVIFDLSDRQFINFYHSDEGLNKYRILSTLSELMHKVIPPSERQHYSVTQLIADCIRQLNFDGVLFNSSVGSGYNLVLFNPDLLEYTLEEADIIEIDDVNYTYNQMEWVDDISKIDKIF